mmetsp:Transcript_74187/g.208264  ORF Transcript_74187/g.208264 Transcript_74187/m.208264 type:complete len:293 (-) Transcript_74187:685-1563(-)
MDCACSFLRFAVASWTSRSNAWMPATRAPIAARTSCKASFVSEMNVRTSLTLRSATFNSSSVLSISLLQNSFLSSSVCCSFFKSVTRASTLARTWSKPFFWPRRASSRKTMRRSFLLAFFSTALAFFFADLPESSTCKKLAGGWFLASVFLKRSSASSSLNILTVSASATFSSANVLPKSCHSAFFCSHAALSCARNFLSSAKPSVVSSSSLATVAFCTASSPARPVFSSMAAVAAAISFRFATTRLSLVAFAELSWAVMSVNCWSISSPICFKMPRISPDCGAYSEPSSLS